MEPAAQPLTRPTGHGQPRPAGGTAWTGELVVGAPMAVAVAVAATPWLRAFRVPAAPLLLAVAAVAPVVLSALAARWWRLPATTAFAVSALGLVLLLLAAVGAHPGAIWDGLAHGPNRLLSETLPLSGPRAVLSAPVVLTWICGAATTEMLVRGRRSAAGLGIPVLMFLVSYAVTSPAPGADDLAAPVLLVVLAAAALAREVAVDRDRHVVDVVGGTDAPLGLSRGPAWRLKIAAVAAVAAVAVALGIGVPGVVLSGRPASLSRAPVVRAGVIVDPVDLVASLRDTDPHAPPTPMVRLETSRSVPGYLAMAILDDYDGDTWTSHATFHPTGGRVPALPAAPGAAGPGTPTVAGATVTVVQHVRLGPRFDLPFVPALDRPAQVRGVVVDADPSTGMLVTASNNAGGAAYTVVSQVPVATLAGVPSADGIGGSLSGTEASTALPADTSTYVAVAVRFLATLTGVRPAPTVAFLQVAERALQSADRRVQPGLGTAKTPVKALGGTSLAEVINAVTVQRAATPEQFATLFVMVARFLGVPARLVTGFRAPPPPGGTPALGPGVARWLSNRDAWTWAEIPVAGVGWVVADPSPAVVVAAGAPPPEAVRATPPTLPPRQANAVPRNQIAGGHAIAPRTRAWALQHSPDRLWLWVLLGVGALIASVAVVVLGVPMARRAARRRTRHASDPAALAVGSWLQLLDGLSRAGMRPADGATTSEVVAEAGWHFGEDVGYATRQVGALADRALYCTTDPPDATSAAGAWAAQRAVVRAALGGLDRQQKARALVAVGHAPRHPSP